MSRLLRRMACLAFLACAAAAPMAACGGVARVEPAIGLMVRISTNAPTLVHVVALEIYVGDKRVFRNVAPVGPGQNEVMLPAKLAVQPGKDPDQVVTIIAYVGDALRHILGKTVAETTIPDDRFAVLDMSVDVICIQDMETTGTIGADETDAHSRCKMGETCKDGQCVSDKVDSDGLSDFVNDDAGGGCLDPEVCLGGPTAYTVSIDKATCTFPAPAGTDVNVGILVAGGVPTRFGNLAVLDRVTGWMEAGAGVLQLQKVICDQVKAGRFPATAVVASGVPGCVTKGREIAVCGGTSFDAGISLMTEAGKDGTIQDTSTPVDSTINDTGPEAEADADADAEVTADTGTDGATCSCSSPPECKKTPGTCSGSTCIYQNAQSGAACTNGTCDANGTCIDVCAGVSCNAAPVCHTTVNAVCSGGVCNYPNAGSDARCNPGTCSNGTCSDPCSGVTCNTPPVCHGATTCTGAGACNYPNAGSDPRCTPGTCSNGTCSNPCSGVTCNTPNNACKLNTGTCAGAGVCSYPNASSGTSCPGGTCDGNGSCVADPCSGITCNAAATPCKTNPGTCSLGTCSYPNASNVTPCPGGTCNGSGSCVLNPCNGVTCNTPGICKTTPGTCSSGTCGYPNASNGSPCAGGTCQTGSCMPYCSGVTCSTPPNDCYNSPGTCSPVDGGPLCSYTPKIMGSVCAGGTCNGSGVCGSSCNPAMCTTPPNDCYLTPGYCTDAGAMCAYNYKSAGSVCAGGTCNGTGTCVISTGED